MAEPAARGGGHAAGVRLLCEADLRELKLAVGRDLWLQDEPRVKRA